MSESQQNELRFYNAILEDWRNLLRGPYPDLAELLLKFTNVRAASGATRNDIDAFLRAIYRQMPRRISENTFDVSVDHDGPYKDKKIRSAKFAGEPLSLNLHSWDHLVIAVCAKVAQENSAEFTRVLRQITSTRSRCYFAEKPDPLTRWELIPGTEIYVEQNLAANNAVSLCNAVANLFGYSPWMEVEIW